MKSTRSLRWSTAAFLATCLLPSCISLWSRNPEPPPRLVGPPPETGTYTPVPAAETKPQPPEVKDSPALQAPKESPPLAPEKPRVKIPTAVPVPGKEGVVFSPFNNKPVDVKGFASGTLVADPTFPLDQKKYFRVP